jgi:DNA repair protein RecN (Recombination protein N)
MLIKLFVQNYALIKELDISPDSGLTVITGETGAGKSILLGALSLVLGSRADTGVLLDKSMKCVVEATFRIKEYDLKDFFAENELDYDHVTLMRREINPAGKSRAFINDTPVNLSLLKELGEKLIDIHSQHQNLVLNENRFQLDVIDSFAGNLKLREEYREVYFRYRALKKEYTGLRENYDKNRTDLEYYQFQLRQLEESKLKEGEQAELERDQEILEHTGEIKAALSGSAAAFSGEGSSILSLVREVRQNLMRIRGYLPETEKMLERLESVYIEMDDLSAEIEKLSAVTDDDPERLKYVNERLDMLYSLMQKHRQQDVSGLISKQHELQEMVSSIETSDERLDELTLLLEKELNELKRLADELSQQRESVIPGVEEKITEMLKQLGMPNARFRVDLKRSADFGQAGIDTADFLFSANRQIPPENISRVASGGELSRVMLSLKSLLARNKNLPAIIFDEIDAGVSGEVADRVGQILSAMGETMQVINITHLPQVASRGRGHYHVYKDDTKHSTITRIKLLSPDERVKEIAKLLSGSEVTETAIRNARELLKAGSRLKS